MAVVAYLTAAIVVLGTLLVPLLSMMVMVAVVLVLGLPLVLVTVLAVVAQLAIAMVE